MSRPQRLRRRNESEIPRLEIRDSHLRVKSADRNPGRVKRLEPFQDVGPPKVMVSDVTSTPHLHPGDLPMGSRIVWYSN